MISFFPSRTVALEIIGWPIHWYGIMYLTAFLIAYILLPRLQKHRGLSLSYDDWSRILSWGVIAVLAGGRLGYVLFYEPHLLLRPMDVISVWNGGMSSHGGFIAVVLVMLLVLKRMRVPLLRFADIVVVPIAIGLALGRVGNFINQELYGTVTDLPWAIAIPGVEGLRHPTQVYAILKDLFIALFCFVHLMKVRPVIPGRTMSWFLLWYSILRFLVEFVRVQDHSGWMGITRGQFLTIPVAVAGVILWFFLRKQGDPNG